ncbi:XRE family transcriptional regulator [Chryseolinea soli]|uniref:XRE family transcriptional regulator n=1 Tax=Chryseolinea soli TaxID=2321403 RepID=A0A385SPI9_9BACT|nr:XRE family transcriptional regulator [Chryseolinea soli]AYB32456.1 XRE family transcriptional regulator [Chryseolinea soli]
MKKLVVKIEKTSTGFSAYCEKYPAFTTGKTLTELSSNMVESLNLYFDEEGKGRKVTARDLNFQLDLGNLFEIFPINVKAFSNRLGMNYTLLIQYVKGVKKPSAKQTEKILEGMQEIGKELCEIRLV